jgi:hypothetical protein
MEEPGEIVGRVGKKFASTYANEQLEILPGHALGIDAGRRLRERGVRKTQGTTVSAQMRHLSEQLAVRTAQQ